MKRICDYCGGQRRWKTGVSVVTGEVFYATCPRCDGTGWIGEDDPVLPNDTEEEKKQQATEQFKKNIMEQPGRKAVQDAIRLFPNAFRR